VNKTVSFAEWIGLKLRAKIIILYKLGLNVFPPYITVTGFIYSVSSGFCLDRRRQASQKLDMEKANDLNKTAVFFFILDTPDRNAVRSLADEFPFHLYL
jgi:hypothetical protein